MKLNRSISNTALLMTSIGGMVGSGWLFGPLYVSRIAGPSAIFAWILGGILMMFIALTFAEVSSSLPLSGGLVRFTHFTHDALVSFTISWMAWLSSVVVAPIETMALLQYASNYVPDLILHQNHTEVLSHFGMMVAALLMMLMIIINRFGAKVLGQTGVFISIIKLAVPLIALITLFIFSFHFSNFQHDGNFTPYGVKSILAALPIGGVIFSFIGYSPAIQLAGEAKTPHCAVPFAIIGSLIICIILYTLLQIVFVGSITPSALIHGWDKLTFSGVNGPFAGLASIFGLSWLMLLIYGDALISPFGTAFIYTATTSRMNFAMSQNGYLPKQMKKLNKNKTPLNAMILNYFVGLLLLLPFPGWQSMVGFLVTSIVIAYIAGPIALVVLRKQQPNLKRPFKLPYSKVIASIAFYVSNLLIYWTGWKTVEVVVFALLIGYVFLIAYKIIQNDRKIEIDLNHSWWLFPFIIGNAAISYFGSFGGKNIIPFGWDFLVIAIFSYAIFQCAVRSAKYKEGRETTIAVNDLKNFEHA